MVSYIGQLYSHVPDQRNFDTWVSQSSWDFSEQSIYPHCCSLVFKSYLTLCVCVCVCVCERERERERERDRERYPTDCSLSGSSALQISQARISEQVVTSFSRESCPPRDRNRVFPAWQEDSLPLNYLAKPNLST